MSTNPSQLVLAVHPTSRGFGWVLFEAPRLPIDWAVASAKPGRKARLIARFERIVKRHGPSVLVIEEPSAYSQALQLDMTHLALLNGMDVVTYPAHVVAQTFSHVGATKKHEIAEYIASHVEAFSHRLPKKRRAFDGPQHSQPLFDAAALALTHFARTGQT